MLTLLRKLRAPFNPQIAFSRALARADAANGARRWAQAEAAYGHALALDPLRADLWVQYGHVLKEQGRIGDAAEAYLQATLRNPLLSDAHCQLGHARIAQERTAEAVDAFCKALALDPGLTGLHETIAALGGVPPGPTPPQPFRDLDDLPVRDADGTVRPITATPSGLASTMRKLPTRCAVGKRRDPVVFLHLHKTGGLTLEEVLAESFAANRICPIRDDHLHLYTRPELDAFDLFSGHFDYGVLRLLRPARTVSVFREPLARLISFYRFHAGHDLGGRHRVNTFAQMANAMSAEAFFEDPFVRQAPEVFNHYLAVFGCGYHQLRTDRPVTVERVSAPLLERASARIRGLDAIGLLERFDDSAALVCDSLGLPPPPAIQAINQSDSLATRMKGKPQPLVAMTARLADALADLTRFDIPLYRVAQQEFERRRRAFKGRAGRR